MITRIVKLQVLPEKKDIFIQVFKDSVEEIKKFEGCRKATLVEDKSDSLVLFTISEWEKESDLEAYRMSPFFKEVWSKAKQTFAEKASAWSVEQIA